MTVRTNLMPEPSCEAGTSNWITTNSTNAYSSSNAHSGSKSLLITKNGSAGFIQCGYGADPNTGIPNAQAFAVTAGHTYTFAYWVKTGQSSITGRADIFWQTSSAFISTSSGSSTSLTVGGYTRVSVTATAPGTAVKCAIALYIGSLAASSADTYADDFLFEESATLNPHFDGSTVQSGFVYAWTGTAHLSTSTETTVVAGGTLLSDDYNRANSTTTIGAPSVGPAPTVLAGVGGINSNQLYASTSTMLASYALGTADVELSAVGNAMNNVNFALCLGIVDVNNYWFMNFRGASGNTCALYQRVAGTEIQMSSSVSMQLPANNGSTVKFNHYQGILHAYVDGVLIMRWKCEVPIASGNHGIRMDNGFIRADSVLAVVFSTADPTLTGAEDLLDFGSGARVVNSGFAYRGRDTKDQDTAGGA